MSVLSVTRAYSDGEVLTEAQIDAIKTDIEGFFNSTKISDDNIQNSGITGSTKLVDNSIATANIADAAISTDKLLDSAVTTAKVVNEAVTNDKIAEDAITNTEVTATFGQATTGTVLMFHTYDDIFSVPRGWMTCDGSVINETNYEAEHGVGSYTTDGIASSSILSKYLPNMAGNFIVGVATTSQTGTTTITTTGNEDHELNLFHYHDTPSHGHFAAIRGSMSAGSGPSFIGYVADTALDNPSSEELSTTESLQPDSIAVLYIMRVI